MFRGIAKAFSQRAQPRTFGLSVWTVAGDEEPTPMTAHQLRASAIRDALQSLPPEQFEIESSSLYDPEPRRLVELVITAYSPFARASSRSKAFLSTELAKAGTESGLARTIANLAELVQAEQEARRIGRIEFHLPDGNRVRCEPDAAPMLIPRTRSQRETPWT